MKIGLHSIRHRPQFSQMCVKMENMSKKVIFQMVQICMKYFKIWNISRACRIRNCVFKKYLTVKGEHEY